MIGRHGREGRQVRNNSQQDLLSKETQRSTRAPQPQTVKVLDILQLPVLRQPKVSGCGLELDFLPILTLYGECDGEVTFPLAVLEQADESGTRLNLDLVPILTLHQGGVAELGKGEKRKWQRSAAPTTRPVPKLALQKIGILEVCCPLHLPPSCLRLDLCVPKTGAGRKTKIVVVGSLN